MEKFTFKQKSEYFYLKIKLDFEANSEDEISLDILKFKRLLLQALESLHGQVGSAISVDVLKYDPSTFDAIIRVPESGLIKVWSAVTLYGSYQGYRCAFRVLQVSTHLIALAVNSRQWVPGIAQ